MRLAYTIEPAPLALGAMCFRDRPFAQILQAASQSAFDGIGLTVGQCISALERGIPINELGKRIEDAGLVVAELELVRLCDDGPTRHANSLVEDLIEALHPDRVHVAAFTGDPSLAADEYAALCQRHPNTPVAVEFMPYSVINDVQAAQKLVCHAGTSNASIVLDVLHFFRSGGQLKHIDAELLERVAVVQLSDVGRRPGVELAREARQLRTYPGRGSLDIIGFLRTIHETQAPYPPISVEPISNALELLPMEVVAEEVMFTTLQVLERAGWIR
ncbi:Inosose isomerase [Arthrobacter sp. 9V]|uniref:sugar phosphate isomerase/epimerase family protein n=1 Tax=Arthrobacter sp. 9V TaxID=2653132 RepID=UPI0012EFB0AC|nr:TIM barrel protein [Arthrobacter sp. 9V]VXC42840.1 Inosose isomerase [Arthrobacter sp. 9V]